jgi:hypothetical protein
VELDKSHKWVYKKNRNQIFFSRADRPEAIVKNEDFLKSEQWAALEKAAGGKLLPNFLKAGEILAAYLKRKGQVMVVIFSPDGIHRARFVSIDRSTKIFDEVISGESSSEEVGIKLQILITRHDQLGSIQKVFRSVDDRLYALVAKTAGV